MKRPDADSAPTLVRRLTLTFLATYGLLVLVAGLDQLRAPFFHFDDAPALFASADAYYVKAVSEGRWFNYLWHLREFRLSSAVNFQLYLIGWALFLAASGVSFFRSGGVQLTIAFALLVALGPQTTQISGWFNTLIPGIWLLAAFAVLTLLVTETNGRWLMAIFIPVSLQAYTPYPFFLLAICLLREDGPRSLKAISQVLGVFIGALVFGILAAQMMNFMIAGDFDIELQVWRKPTPASDITGLIANVPKVWASLVNLYHSTGFGRPAYSIGIVCLFAVSLAIVVWEAWSEALGVVLVVAIGLGALMTYSLLEGIVLPFRATSFLWFVMAFTITRATSMFGEKTSGIRGLASVPGVVVTVLFVFPAMQDFRSKSEWQNYVASILKEVPPNAERIYLYGAFNAVPRSPRESSDFDLSIHLLHMSGLTTTDCTLLPENCVAFGAPFVSRPHGYTTRVRMVDGAALILPARWDTSG